MNIFLKRDLLLFTIILLTGIMFNVFYYYINKPRIDFNYIKQFQKQYFLTRKKELFLEKKLKTEKKIYVYYKAFTFNKQELQMYKKAFNIFFNIFNGSLKCSYFGIVRDKNYFNVINIYYKCDDLKNAEEAKLILKYFLKKHLNFLKNVYLDNQYIILQIFKKKQK